MLKRLNAILLGLVFLTACAKPDTSSQETQSPQRYVVVLNKNHVESKARTLAFGLVKAESAQVVAQALDDMGLDHQLKSPSRVFSVVLQGGVYELSKEDVKALGQDSRVAYIEEDRVIRISESQAAAPWGLDRLDQAALPLNKVYNYSQTASNVNAYVIDTGILLSHKEFGGRAVSGFDAVDGGDAIDCNGHGTHVSGTIASQSFGVAKAAKLYAVRVLDCDGSGSISSVVAGIEWVTANHKKPAVANMSLGGGSSKAIDDAVAASVQAGVTYVVAAGNESTLACNSSPARSPSAITVGATNSSDGKASFSNYGSCVSLFAPGQDILSTWSTSSSATNTISGTSMASPHVAGVAALYLAGHPNASPSEVKSALIAGSLSGKVSNSGSGSPNLLLNTAFLSSSTPPPPPPPPVVDNILKSGIAVKLPSAVRANEKAYEIVLPAAGNLLIEISGGSGDADLYVKAGSKPSLSSFDCRPYKTGSTESCKVAAKAGVIYHVLIRAYSAYSNVSVKATY